MHVVKTFIYELYVSYVQKERPKLQIKLNTKTNTK